MLVDQKCRHFEYVRSKIKFLAMAFFDKGFFGLTRMNKGLSSMAGSIFIATIINSRFLNWELSKDLIIDKYKLHFESLQRFPLNRYQSESICLRRVSMPTQLIKVNGQTSQGKPPVTVLKNCTNVECFNFEIWNHGGIKIKPWHSDELLCYVFYQNFHF